MAMSPEDLYAIARAVRAEHQAEIIEERIAAHWSTLHPRVDDENTVISAALTGLLAPVELGVPRGAFTGHRWNIWQAIELHYAEAGGFEAPDMEELARWIHERGVRGPVLDELRTLRDEQAFVVEEYVYRAAMRLIETHRAREMCGALERAVLQLHAGAPVSEIRETLGRILNG